MSLSSRRRYRWGFQSSASDHGDCYSYMLSVGQQRGRIVEVYDGRTWPVVQCGSVYVTCEDTAQQVTNTIVTGTSIAERKKRASKYTIAIGTTHGHVQAFLDDTDIVLSALDSCHAEEKCLMLIKRPKNLSKKMLKAHSWANLSVTDSQLYRHLDGSWPTNTKTDSKKHKIRWKKTGGSSMASVASSSSSLAAGHIVSSPRDGKENSFREEINSHVFSPLSSNKSYLNNKNSGYERCASHREINNNSTYRQGKVSLPGRVAGYPLVSQSYTDIPTLPIVSESDDEDCRIGNDQLYSTVKVNKESGTASGGDQVFRAHSLGDLTTGLTLSVVGQRKADSMLNLSVLPNSGKGSRNRTSPVPGETRFTQYSETNGNIMEESIPEEKAPVLENGRLSQQSRCSDQGRISASSVSSREKTPLKGKRSLPHVPVSEASERIKRFTELMRARMALHSSASQSTASVGSMPVTPQQAEHITTAVPVTPSDSEVSEVFSPHSRSCLKTNPQYNTREQVDSTASRERYYSEARSKQLATGMSKDPQQSTQPKGGYSMSLHSTPQLPGDRSTDSGQTTLTSHSHSSTMDSGYTTNNDCDSEIYATMPHHTHPSKRMAQSINQSVRDAGYINKYSSSMNPRTYSDYTNGVYQQNATDSGKKAMYIDNTKYSGNRLAPQQTPVIRGFCPVKEEEVYQGYRYDDHQPHHTPRTANQSWYSGQKKWHYGSQPNLYVPDVKTSGDEQGGQFHQPHRNKPLALRQQSSTNGKTRLSERHLSNSYRIPEQNWNSVHVSESVPFKSVCVQSASHRFSSGTEQSDMRPDSQSSMDKLRYSTLPGNWRFHGKEDTGYGISAAKFPTLYQLSQFYTFHGTKVVLPQTVPLEESLKLTDKVIELPSLRECSSQDSGPSWMPQGQYAQLGGPGSAFRPVRSSGLTTFTLVSIESFQEDILSSTGTLSMGDLLVEMNGRLILGADSKLVHKTLEIIQGEIILTVARNKQDLECTSMKMDHMVKEIDFLRAQIAQRDNHIKELQTVCPWHRDVASVNEKMTIHNDIPNEEVEISDDEFIV